MNGQATKYHLFDLPMQNQDPIFFYQDNMVVLWNKGGLLDSEGSVWQPERRLGIGGNMNLLPNAPAAEIETIEIPFYWDSFLFFYRKWGEMSRPFFEKS